MPTGYTDPISKGISFEEFALSCARAFGACITMRDDPMDKPIPVKFEPSDYHVKALAQEEANLKKLNSTTIEEAEEMARLDYEREAKRIRKACKEDEELVGKYNDMLTQVRTWTPPTPEHVEFKKFMIDQIEQSIDHDDMRDYYAENPAKRLSGEEWLREKIKDTIRNIAYHKKEYKEECERCEGRSNWVKALRDSLICQKFGTDECDTCDRRFRCFTIVNYKEVTNAS